MIDRDSPVTEVELHAYIDGELPGDRMEAVASWLAAHPEQAALVASWRAQAESIRARYGAAAEVKLNTANYLLRRNHSHAAR